MSSSLSQLRYVRPGLDRWARYARMAGAGGGGGSYTPRMRRILTGLAEEKTQLQIAREEGVTKGTINITVGRLYRLLGADARTVVRRAGEEGLISAMLAEAHAARNATQGYEGRKRPVLLGVAEGLTSAQIAERLAVHPNTPAMDLMQIRRELAATPATLLDRAVEEGWITAEERAEREAARVLSGHQIRRAAVLTGLAQGTTYDAIGVSLGVVLETIRADRRRLEKALGTADLEELLERAAEAELFPREELAARRERQAQERAEREQREQADRDRRQRVLEGLALRLPAAEIAQREGVPRAIISADIRYLDTELQTSREGLVERAAAVGQLTQRQLMTYRSLASVTRPVPASRWTPAQWKRRIQVLDALVEGWTVRQVAAAIETNRATVLSDHAALKAELGCGLDQLVERAVEVGWLKPERLKAYRGRLSREEAERQSQRDRRREQLRITKLRAEQARAARMEQVLELLALVFLWRLASPHRITASVEAGRSPEPVEAIYRRLLPPQADRLLMGTASGVPLRALSRSLRISQRAAGAALERTVQIFGAAQRWEAIVLAHQQGLLDWERLSG